MSTTLPAPLPAPLTADAFFDHPAAKGPSELVRGEIRLMSPTGGRHGQVAAQVHGFLWRHVQESGLGVAFADGTGFRLPIPGDVDDSVRSPHAAVVLAAHMPPASEAIGFMPLAPDLAVEIISPSESAAELHEKLGDYIAAGTSLIWVIDPARWTVEIHTQDTAVRRLREGDTLDGAPVLPDFRCAVADLFAGIARPAPRPAPPAEPR